MQVKSGMRASTRGPPQHMWQRRLPAMPLNCAMMPLDIAAVVLLSALTSDPSVVDLAAIHNLQCIGLQRHAFLICSVAQTSTVGAKYFRLPHATTVDIEAVTVHFHAMHSDRSNNPVSGMKTSALMLPLDVFELSTKTRASRLDSQTPGPVS